jgi:hypothetical protein
MLFQLVFFLKSLGFRRRKKNYILINKIENILLWEINLILFLKIMRRLNQLLYKMFLSIIKYHQFYKQ